MKDHSSACWFVILGSIIMLLVNADLFVVLSNHLRCSYRGWANFVMGYYLVLSVISIMSYFVLVFCLRVKDSRVIFGEL